MGKRGKSKPLYLCVTKAGKFWHVTTGGRATLCGRLVHKVARNWRTDKPIPYGDHWRNDAVDQGLLETVCEHCERMAAKW